MRIAYICLSPTLGMHQYTADLANRMSERGHEVHLVSSARLPRDRYAASLHQRTPLANRTTGFSSEGLQLRTFRRLAAVLESLQADVNHFTAPHLWNPLLLRRLQSATMHTLHDLDPHQGGGALSSLLVRLWNRLVLHSADHILVHGQVYRRRLLASGHPPAKITTTPLLHLMFSQAVESRLRGQRPDPTAATGRRPYALFFGRLLPYKGLDVLLSAWQRLAESGRFPGDQPPSLVVAGAGDVQACWQGTLPAGVELRNHWLDDEETVMLFGSAALVVLPYVSATQSALVAAAYFFGKPVIVADSGALAEYVQPGITGWVTPPCDAPSLAAALAAAFDDPARLAQMGAAGRAWYDQQRVLEFEALQQTYTRLAAKGNDRITP
ncbi:MAG: glycosyltransferase [Caldilineales bacterium]|nr:glycosyltransferase [Caldilineales bacterium]